MKYENKETDNQEKIIEQAKSLMHNLNHYSIYIYAVDAYSKSCN